MLRLLAILPRQVHNKRPVILVLAHIHSLHVVLPAPARRLPLHLLGARGRRAVERVLGAAVLFLRALRLARRRGPGLPTALAPRQRRLCLCKELVLAADRRVVLVEGFGRVLAVNGAGRWSADCAALGHGRN